MTIIELIIKALGGYTQPVSPKPTTVEDLRTAIANMGKDQTDVVMCQLWHDIDQVAYEELAEIAVTKSKISPDDWVKAAQATYPTLTDIKVADSELYVVCEADLQKILSRDWTNKIPYIADIFDCDKFADTLYIHLCQYYQINSVVPVWGDTDQGYHGFDLAVMTDGVKLVEPQTATIFVDSGPLGKYIPRQTAIELGIVKIGKRGA